MPTDRYEFEAEIVPRSFDKYDYSVVFLPAEVQAVVPFPGGRPLRVDAEVGGVPLGAALMPHDGRRYLLLSKKFLKRLRAAIGDRVFVTFTIADQDAVDVPEELRKALEANTDASKAWDAATAGRQRGLAYRVASAKRPETRRKRVEEVLAELVAD
ncbi:MAG: YdeI/OmpD-associated family protein [Planctomycetota bacterium]